jgi:hypothetical protein
MGFLDDVSRRVKNNVTSQVSSKTSSIINSAINTGVNTAVNKVKHSGDWKCSCGVTNTGKFCTNCGKAKDAGICKCPKCGWTSSSSRPKFCPECGTSLSEEESKSDDGGSHSAAVNGDVTLGNMTDYMTEVPDELEDRARALENTFNNVKDVSQLKDAVEQLKGVATDTQNIMFGNMSVLAKALGNTEKQVGNSSNASVFDKFSEDLSNLSKK